MCGRKSRGTPSSRTRVSRTVTSSSERRRQLHNEGVCAVVVAASDAARHCEAEWQSVPNRYRVEHVVGKWRMSSSIPTVGDARKVTQAAGMNIEMARNSNVHSSSTIKGVGSFRNPLDYDTKYLDSPRQHFIPWHPGQAVICVRRITDNSVEYDVPWLRGNISPRVTRMNHPDLGNHGRRLSSGHGVALDVVERIEQELSLCRRALSHAVPAVWSINGSAAVKREKKKETPCILPSCREKKASARWRSSRIILKVQDEPVQERQVTDLGCLWASVRASSPVDSKAKIERNNVGR
ncbi:hypothetical protein DFH06DRAFT_1132433 [Mycena polygramma]|nr:hypothetical protein DFH06DRAFT_1132433 [Mycena polygramma]